MQGYILQCVETDNLKLFSRSCSVWTESTPTTLLELQPPQVLGNVVQKF